MIRHTPFLSAVLATAVLASSAAAVATDAHSTACDPMYPCVADTGTPAAVYDLAAQTDQGPCQSYPCYPDHAASANPVTAGATTPAGPVGQSI
ncbi:MAG: hypothetical protein MUE39_05800 [Gammaproteobacteria bacterium]|jgi:hypothetical protein|nr:hypothetical protein [Gammaproteobacteria bacterium]